MLLLVTPHLYFIAKLCYNFNVQMRELSFLEIAYNWQVLLVVARSYSGFTIPLQYHRLLTFCHHCQQGDKNSL